MQVKNAKVLLIKRAKIVNADRNLCGIFDILVENGIIVKIEKNIEVECDNVLDVSDYVVMPGLIDMHVHSRDPGDTDKEDLHSCMDAAARGGITTIAVMPNTRPVVDNEYLVSYILEKANKYNGVNVLPVGSITKGLNGVELSPYGKLKETGIVAISDDGFSVPSANIFKNALAYSKAFDLPVLSHSETRELSEEGHMNDGALAMEMGLKGISNISESLGIYRDIEIANSLGVNIHICHVSTKESVDVIRQAKKRGCFVTAETAPHYFVLTEEFVRGYNTNGKVNPPLRSEADRIAIINAIVDNTIDVIASDHAPHNCDEKNLPFELASNGTIGLETLFSVSYTYLVKSNFISVEKLVEKMSLNPAKILKLPNFGVISIGSMANFTIFDEKEAWKISSEKFCSKSKNTMFDDFEVFGSIKYTIVSGKIVFRSNA